MNGFQTSQAAISVMRGRACPYRQRDARNIGAAHVGTRSPPDTIRFSATLQHMMNDHYDDGNNDDYYVGR